MLLIKKPATELYDEINEIFIPLPQFELRFEHSLAAISKWESKWKIPFLSDKKPKTNEQFKDYVKCMIVPHNALVEDVDILLSLLSMADYKKIGNYIDDSHTATWFREDPQDKFHGPSKVVTSELIYSWMCILGIDWSAENWHLNRLLTLIRCISEQQKPPKKMSTADLLSRNRAINAARKKALHTHG